MSKSFPQIDSFRKQLHETGNDFVCNTPLPQSSASVLFLGKLHGEIVLWNMTLATLKHYGLIYSKEVSVTKAGSPIRPFIEINQGYEGIHILRVGLDLETIDEQVIKKTIIMVRNYKRLLIGKIEFGNY